MFLKVARAIARPQTFAVLDLLKRSSGLSVNELAKALKLSYMGVKQYCTELEKKGLVDTWRRPTSMGRPEKSYRLTPKAAAFYPEVGNEMTLDLLKSIALLYGDTAPDKLLFNYFNKKADAYLKKIKGTTLTERAASFAKLRDAEGCCAQIEYDEVLGFRVVEFHSPLKEIAEAYPSVQRMEELMFNKVLGCTVQRSEERISGLLRISFLIPLSVVPQGLASTAMPKVSAPAKAPRLKRALPITQEVAPEPPADQETLVLPVFTESDQPALAQETAEVITDAETIVAQEESQDDQAAEPALVPLTEPEFETIPAAPTPMPVPQAIQEELFLLVG